MLAVLETGAGKTLISSLLMEHIEQQRADRETARLERVAQGSLDEADQQAEEKKLMFFVVNRSARCPGSLALTLRSVPLVHQQAQLIAAKYVDRQPVALTRAARLCASASSTAASASISGRRRSGSGT